jgi:hypothetical protein
MSRSTDTPSIPNLPLKLDELRRRLESNAYTNYTNLSWLIKGGVLAAASLALIEISSSQSAAWITASRVFLWVASMGFVFVTYATWLRGSIFATANTNFLDVVYPVAMGLVEYGLFAILSPKAPISLPFSYLLFSLHALFAVLLTSNRLKQTTIKDFERDISEPDKIFPEGLPSEYIKWVGDDKRGARMLSAITFGVFVVMIYWKRFWTSPESAVYHMLFVTSLLLMAIFIIRQATSQYRRAVIYIARSARRRKGTKPWCFRQRHARRLSTVTKASNS